jgi:hypothetical protein
VTGGFQLLGIPEAGGCSHPRNRGASSCRFATLARAAERLLRIALDATLQAPSLIDGPAAVA